MTTKRESPTLADALALYRIEVLAGGQLAPLTRDAYRRDLEDLITWFAEHLPTTKSIDHVGLGHLERYLASLDERGLAIAYRRRKVAAIRSFFGFLQQHKLLPCSPASDLAPPLREHARPRVLTETEYKRLIESVRHEPRDGAIIEVFLQTGLRLSELSRLRLEDIEVPAENTRPVGATNEPGSMGAVQVAGKGCRQRTVMLTWKACTAITAYLAVRPDSEDDRLFVTKFHRGMGPRAIERVVEKYLKDAHIADASVHSLRHTFATHQTRRGIKLSVIQQALGHESLATTSIYVDLARDVMDKELQQNAL